MPVKRQHIWWIMVALGSSVLLMVVLGVVLLFLELATVHNEGSPSLAMKWRNFFLAQPNPDVAVSRSEDVFVVHFPSGEWIMGLAQESHGIWPPGGGTVVLKDSNGQVRAFFGHVCGGGDALRYDTRTVSNLASYYRYLQSDLGGYHEYAFSTPERERENAFRPQVPRVLGSVALMFSGAIFFLWRAVFGKPMTFPRAMMVILTSAFVFALVGGTVGFGIGTYFPDYYRDLFLSGRSPEFNPVSVGIGQGVTQGVSGGAGLGVVLVAILAWYETRMGRSSARNEKVTERELMEA